MKRVCKALVAIFLIFTMQITALAATSNVMVMQGYQALVSACGGIALPDAPQGAQQVQYSFISGERPIAQVRFDVEGVTYHLRACACSDEQSMTDISAMKAIFGVDGLKEVTSTAGQDYHCGVKGTNALAEWFDAQKLCQYSLLGNGVSGEDAFRTLTEAIQQSAQAVTAVHEKGTSVDGTVSKISKKSITLTNSAHESHVFTITERTVNHDAKKIKRNVSVRVNFEGEYAKGCEALSITLVSSSSGGHGGKPTNTPKPTKTPKPTATPNPNKHSKADGVLTMLSGNMFEMRTSKGASLAFLIEDAEVTGGDYAEIGCKVSVEYNTVNGATHLVKVQFVHVEPTNTPAPPTHKKNGTILSRDDDTLTIQPDNAVMPMDFDVSQARIKGDTDADEGDNAEVTYYENEDGVLIATIVVLSRYDPDPGPEPDPIDDIGGDFEENTDDFEIDDAE